MPEATRSRHASAAEKGKDQTAAKFGKNSAAAVTKAAILAVGRKQRLRTKTQISKSHIAKLQPPVGKSIHIIIDR